MLAKVPRIMTSWLPRREPNELKSRRSTPFSIEIARGRAVRRDRTGRRDVVGRHRVAEQREDARAPDIAGRRDLGAHPRGRRRLRT